MLKSTITLLLTLILLGGCATIDPNDPVAIGRAIQRTYDGYQKTTRYTGPNCAQGIFDRCFLRAWRRDGAEYGSYQIYVFTSYKGDWRFYDRAFDSNGQSLDLTVIKKDVGDCGYGGCYLHEHLGVNIDRGYLEKHTQTGVNFQISGRGGKAAYFVPPAYVQAFLATIPFK